MSYKSKPEKMGLVESEFTGIVMVELSEYFGDYEITFQFWGPGQNHAFIEKDGIELWDKGGFEIPLKAMVATRNYLDKINNKKREYNPNF